MRKSEAKTAAELDEKIRVLIDVQIKNEERLRNRMSAPQRRTNGLQNLRSKLIRH